MPRRGELVSLQDVETTADAARQAQWVHATSPSGFTESARDKALALMCCDYSTQAPDGVSPAYYLNAGSWAGNKPVPGMNPGYSHEANFTGKPGAVGSTAIPEILMHNPPVTRRLDCAAMMTTVHYKALLDVLGPTIFDSVIASRGLRIVGFKTAVGAPEHDLVSSGLFQRVPVPVGDDPTKFLIAGDRVYFKNVREMVECDRDNVYKGEHALYVGNGNFAAFGIGPSVPYDGLITKLFDALTTACNKKIGDPNTPAAQKQDLSERMSLIEKEDLPGLGWSQNPKKRFALQTEVYRLNVKRLRRLVQKELAKLKAAKRR